MRSMHASRVRGPTEIADRTRDGQQHASRKHMMQLAGYSTPDQPGRGSIGPTDTQETQRTDTLSGTVTDWSTNRKVMGGWEQTERAREPNERSAIDCANSPAYAGHLRSIVC